MKKNIRISISFMILILLLTACGREEKTTPEIDAEEKLKIYTTIYPFQYFTERIGGEFISVENIIPPGADAHSIEITMKKMMKIAESDAFIHSGTGLEGFAEAVVESVKDENVKVVEATENIDLISGQAVTHLEETEEIQDEHGDEESEDTQDENRSELDIDPHVWLDPIRSTTIAKNIKNALIVLNPENTEEFEKNFNLLKNDLEQLDEKFKNMVKTSDTKTFIVSHSAYGYWEDVYGLEQIGISGLSPTDEPSQSELIEIIDLVKDKNLTYIFFEPNLTNKVADAIKKETGSESLILNNLESRTENNINANEDHLEIMEKNIDTLKQALTKE